MSSPSCVGSTSSVFPEPSPNVTEPFTLFGLVGSLGWTRSLLIVYTATWRHENEGRGPSDPMV